MPNIVAPGPDGPGHHRKFTGPVYLPGQGIDPAFWGKYFANAPVPGYVNQVSTADRNLNGTITPGTGLEILYGQRKLEWKLIGRLSAGGGTDTMLGFFCNGEITAYDKIMVNGVEIVESNTCTVARYYGTLTQAYDPDVAFFLGNQYRFPGRAYLAITISSGDSQYATITGGGTISANISGKKVYDPRDNRLTFSEDFSTSVWTFDAAPTVTTGIEDEWDGTSAVRWEFPGSGPHSVSRTVPLIQDGLTQLTGTLRIRTSGSDINCNMRVRTDVQDAYGAITITGDWLEFIISPNFVTAGTTSAATLELFNIPSSSVIEIEPGASLQAGYSENYGYSKAMSTYGKTTLRDSVGSSDLYMFFADPAGFPVIPFDIYIDSEQITVSSLNPVTGKAIIARGINGTSSAMHTAGHNIVLVTDLNGSVSGGATTIVVDGHNNWPPTPFVVTIGADTVTVSNVAGNTWTVSGMASSHVDETRVHLSSTVGMIVTPWTKFSANSSLVLSDYLIDSNFGVGYDVSKLNYASTGRGAARCDEVVDGVEPRWRINGTVSGSGTADQYIESLRACFTAELYEEFGKLNIFVPGPQGTPVITFDTAFNPEITPTTYNAPAVQVVPSLLGATERPTYLVVSFSDSTATIPFTTNSKSYQSPSIITGKVRSIPTTLKLDNITSPTMAQRVCDYYGEQGRICARTADLTIPFLGDVLRKKQCIHVKDSDGFEIDALVDSYKLLQTGEMQISVRETSDSLYGSTAAWIPGEQLSGVIDGVNRDFTISRPATAGILRYNGIAVPSSLYVQSGTNITLLAGFLFPPNVGDALTYTYVYSRGVRPRLAWISNETLSGTKDGVNDVFATSQLVNGNKGEIFLNLSAVDVSTYTISGSTVTINSGTLPVSTDIWSISYEYSTPGLPATTWVFNEIPSGAVNGSNKVFVIASLPINSVCELDIDGTIDPSNYSLVGQTLTLGAGIVAPVTGEIPMVSYKKAA